VPAVTQAYVTSALCAAPPISGSCHALLLQAGQVLCAPCSRSKAAVVWWHVVDATAVMQPLAPLHFRLALLLPLLASTPCFLLL
jgi:hypothetical protein